MLHNPRVVFIGSEEVALVIAAPDGDELVYHVFQRRGGGIMEVHVLRALEPMLDQGQTMPRGSQVAAALASVVRQDRLVVLDERRGRRLSPPE